MVTRTRPNVTLYVQCLSCYIGNNVVLHEMYRPGLTMGVVFKYLTFKIIYKRIYIYIYMCVCIYVCIDLYMYVCIRAFFDEVSTS